MRTSYTAALILLLSVAGCDSGREPLAPELPAMQASLAQAGLGGAAPRHHVSGTVYLDWSVYGGGRTMYSFNARLDAEGGAHGFFQGEHAFVDDEPGGVRFRADVVCLAVEGGDAWLGVRVTGSDAPTFLAVGAEAVVRVRDAGEGGHIGEPELDDLLDQNHDGVGRLVTAASAASCLEKRRTGDFWPLWWIDRGNIDVR
jgi:hypothetical protein